LSNINKLNKETIKENNNYRNNKSIIDRFISKVKQNRNSDISDNQILVDLISKSDNINLKTRIYNARDFTMLNVIAKILEKFNLNEAAKTLSLFNDLYKEFMISENGKSRQELVNVLANRKKENDEQELSFAKRLTTNLNEIQNKE